MVYQLPINVKTLLDLLNRGRIEFLGMKTTDKRDEFDLVVRVK
jgi:hypothetical protein